MFMYNSIRLSFVVYSNYHYNYKNVYSLLYSTAMCYQTFLTMTFWYSKNIIHFLWICEIKMSLNDDYYKNTTPPTKP